MAYIPTIVIDDDDESVLKIFRLKSAANGVNVVTFTSWDKTKEYLEGGNIADAVILDARGQLNADKAPGDAHLLASYAWVKEAKIPYAIYTAYYSELPILEQELVSCQVKIDG